MTEYSGSEFLEVLEQADNYNSHIFSLIQNKLSIDSEKQNSKVILDFGSGSGTFAKRFMERKQAVECLEIDPKLAQITENLGITTHSELSRIEDKHFSAAYSVNVLEHIKDDAEALRELSTRLRPGSKIFLWVPAFPILFSKFDTYVGHYRRYTIKSMRETVEKAGGGLSVMEIRYADSLGFPVALVFRLLGISSSPSPLAIALYDKVLFPLSKFVDYLLGSFFGKNLWVVIKCN